MEGEVLISRFDKATEGETTAVYEATRDLTENGPGVL